MDSYTLNTPVGWIRLESDGTALLRLILNAPRPAGARCPPSALLSETADQLLAYFRGDRTSFTVPLRPEGTGFEKAVWSCLRDVPYGETRSYRDIARCAGSENGWRAVGNAVGRNPIPILIPCHRIIRSDGRIGGFTGGIPIKESLLQLESTIRTRQLERERKKRSRSHRSAAHPS